MTDEEPLYYPITLEAPGGYVFAPLFTDADPGKTLGVSWELVSADPDTEGHEWYSDPVPEALNDHDHLSESLLVTLTVGDTAYSLNAWNRWVPIEEDA